MSFNRKYMTSTGVSKELEIIVPEYKISLLFPSKDSNNYFSEFEPSEEEVEDIVWQEEVPTKEVLPTYLSEQSTRGNTLPDHIESSPDLIAPPASNFMKMSFERAESEEPADSIVQSDDDEMKIDLSQNFFQPGCEIGENNEESFSEHSLFTFNIPSFLEKFGLKEENIRQTVIRRFKFCMKKISQDLNRYKKISNAKYLKLIFRIMKLYFLDINDRDFAENAYLEIRDLIDQFGTDRFRAFYNESSCNDTYVRALFDNPIMRKLYRLHHSLGSQSELYFKKFKQFQHRTLNQEDRQQIIMYCDQFLDIYT